MAHYEARYTFSLASAVMRQANQKVMASVEVREWAMTNWKKPLFRARTRAFAETVTPKSPLIRKLLLTLLMQEKENYKHVHETLCWESLVSNFE
jgi:hypothetical protein